MEKERKREQIQLPLDITIYEDDLVSLVYDKLNSDLYEIKFYKKDLKVAMRTFTESIRECLLSGNKVNLKDFAIMNTYEPKPSIVNHPQTGEPIFKGKSNRVKFSPIGEFKESLKIKE